jgi:hypothetical protein
MTGRPDKGVGNPASQAGEIRVHRMQTRATYHRRT